MSEREKQKPEEKVKIVIKYIAGEVSISGAASSGWLPAGKTLYFFSVLLTGRGSKTAGARFLKKCV